jgi:preprotein translocase subunit Sss1
MRLLVEVCLGLLFLGFIINLLADYMDNPKEKWYVWAALLMLLGLIGFASVMISELLHKYT